MSILHAVFFGIIEGITEFLPVSSTGHLILSAKIFGLAQSDFMKSFEIAIQLGAILSIVALYWKSLLIDYKTQTKILFAFIPTVVLGAIFYKFIKSRLLSSHIVVLVSLFAGGVILIIFELFNKRDKSYTTADVKDISLNQAFIVGLCQSAAMVPGVSRSLATILGGLSLGISREAIVKFSFLLAVPTMLSATLFDLLKSSSSFSGEQFYYLAIGFIVSFIVALMSVKFLINYIQKHTFIIFGIYRVFISLLLWFLFI